MIKMDEQVKLQDIKLTHRNPLHSYILTMEFLTWTMELSQKISVCGKLSVNLYLWMEAGVFYSALLMISLSPFIKII